MGKTLRIALTSVLAVLTACAIAGTIVLSVFAGKKKSERTMRLSDSTVASAVRDRSVFSENINVPYKEVDASYTVYVAPNGDDSKDGTTKENAVRTLKGAQNLVRAYFASHDGGVAMMVLCDGEYYLNSPLELTQDDVGGGSLYIRAEHNNKATLSGSTVVDPSTVTETADPVLGRVWTIPCEEKINQLYVGESYGIRARYPDAGTEIREMNTDKVYKEIIFDGNLISDFEPSDFDGAVMTVNVMWGDSYLRIDSVRTEKVYMNYTGNGAERLVGKIKINYQDTAVFARTGLEINSSSRCPFHFENSKAFLNQPGEWFYDEEAKVVYYLPRPNEKIGETTVRLPHSEVLVEATGMTDAKIKNITFEGLKFAYTANSYVDGKIGGQGNRNDNANTKRFIGGVNDARPIAALAFENVENITFSGNLFTLLGDGALDFVSGAKDITVTKNVFASVGGNGVLVGPTSTDITAVKKDPNTFNVNIDANNNYLTDIGWQEYGSCGIIYTYSLDSKVNYNTINNVRYTAISAGWGWDTTATDYPFYNGVEIGYNRITGVVNLLADGGAIYTIGAQEGARIHDNYVGENYSSVYTYPDDMGNKDGKWYACCGIYLDNTSGGRTPIAEGERWEDGKGFIVENNYVADDTLDQPYQTVNARKSYKTDDGKTYVYYIIDKADESKKEEIYNASGVKEDGFTVLPTGCVLWGSHTESAEVSTVFGNGLGTRQDTALILKGKDGKQVQLAPEDILSWTDTAVTFKTANYLSGEVFAMNKEGKASNAIVATLNVDRQYCMLGQFEENWGGLSGLERDLQTHTISLNNDAKHIWASSYHSAFEPKWALDGNSGSLWASDPTDPDPTIEIYLDGEKVGRIVLNARTDGGGDAESRYNVTVSVRIRSTSDQADENGFEWIKVKDITEEDGFAAFGAFEMSLAGTPAEGKLIYGVQVKKTVSNSENHFLTVADVILIAP